MSKIIERQNRIFTERMMQLLQRVEYMSEEMRSLSRDVRLLKEDIAHVKKLEEKIANIGEIDVLLSSEEARIQAAILLTSSRKEAAEVLGMTERTLYRKIKEYGLEDYKK